MSFEHEKKEFLGKRDKSRKGSIDNKIKKLVSKINSLQGFYTTSSCSGRVLLLAEHSSGRKDKAFFLFSSHEKLNFKKIKIKKILNNTKKDVWFRAEPAILHVACKNAEDAKALLDSARNIGFRRSGIISIGKSRLVLELISTERIDAIISRNGKILIGDNYFKTLTKEGNKKLEKTWKKIDILHRQLTNSKVNISLISMSFLSWGLLCLTYAALLFLLNLPPQKDKHSSNNKNSCPYK